MHPMPPLVRDEDGAVLAVGDVVSVPGRLTRDAAYNATILEIKEVGDKVRVTIEFGIQREVKKGGKLSGITKSSGNTHPLYNH